MRPVSLLISLALLASPASAVELEELDEAAFFEEEERELLEFNIDDPENILTLMGDLEGSSMIIKVKDPDGETVGVFKPTSGNTSHISEIVAYRLCRRLDLPVCAPAMHKTLGRKTLRRFAKLRGKKRFRPPPGSRHAAHFEAKERFRKGMLRRLREADSLPGAFKAWVSPLVLYEGLGRLGSVMEHPLFEYVHHDAPRPGKTFELRQCTQIYKPKGCYRAPIPYSELLEQFTGILIVDALIGNNDRFAGGNVHMFSLEGRTIREGKDRYRLPSPSLLMLDNGAGFMRAPSGALNVIRRELRITRFPRNQYEGLKHLWKDYNADRSRVMRELALVDRFRHGGRTYGPAKVFARNLRRLIRYLDSLEKKYGENAWQ